MKLKKSAYLLFLVIFLAMGAGLYFVLKADAKIADIEPPAIAQKGVVDAPVDAQAATAREVAVPNDSQWKIRCETLSDNPQDKKESCEIFQRLSIKDTGQRVAELAFGQDEKQFGTRTLERFVLIMPLGILAQNPIEMRVNGAEWASPKIEYCAQLGCVASGPVTADMLAKLGQGGVLQFKAMAPNGRPVTIDMSLDGFNTSRDVFFKS